MEFVGEKVIHGVRIFHQAPIAIQLFSQIVIPIID